MYTMLLALVLADVIDPTLGPAPVPAPTPVDALTAEVVEACGDIYALEELAFTFIVEKEGAEVVRRSHVWRPQEGSVAVSWEGFSATLSSVYPMVAGEGVSAEDADKAHGAFINDAYWLLAPCKVGDPGVKRALDDEGRLVLTFDGVGRTPGDRYTLTVDPDTHELRRWDFQLQSGREGAFTWEAYQDVGPLRLATDHRAVEGDMRIRFEDLSAR